jgi:hypothetical protein
MLRKQVTLGLGCLAAAVGALAQETHPVPVFINGGRLDSDALMLQEVSRTVLPMRTLFESLGARVEWDAAQRAVYAWKPDGTGLRLGLGEGSAQTLKMAASPGPGNWGRIVSTQRLDAPAMLIGSRVYVPLRWASEALRADVRYVSARPAVYIQTEAVAGIRQEGPGTPEDVRQLEEERRARERQAQLERQRVEQERQERERQARLDRETELRRQRELELQREAERRREAEEREAALRRELEEQREREAERRRPALVREALRDGIEVSLVVRGERFRTGDDVPIVIIVRNRSDRTLAVPFETGQQFDLEVLQENRVLWSWAAHRTFSQARSRLVLRPGEDETFTVRWNGGNNNGRAVNPGRYLIRAVLLAPFESPNFVGEERITIRR